MKNRISKRILAGILTFGMAASLMPATAFAAQTVTTTPGNEELQVEYFSSTLYNWDESAANAATAAADRTGEITYESAGSVRYSQIVQGQSSEPVSTSYWYQVNGNYYPVYYTCERNPRYYTYILYYYDGNDYQQFDQSNRGYDYVSGLYTQTGGSYEGKGFYFTASDNKGDNVPDFSSWVENSQNYMIYSGLAASNLNESSNVPFSDNVNAANLFATDGSNSEYADVYTNVGVPYVYDEETGYYTLDSDSNAVYFEDGVGSSNTRMLIADMPAYYTGYSGVNNNVTGFAPFNGLSRSTGAAYMAGSLTDSNNRTQAYKIEESENTNSASTQNGMKYGFGMVTTVDFQMTDDGKDANGNDITFEFAGDDDVWVYVDGVLALDIGGTHDAITGTINFATGDVTLHSADGYNTIGDLATDKTYPDSEENPAGMSQTNLYTALGKTLTGFASEGTHTLTIYYMDRGQGRTNCLIKFNLPQRDTVSVTKEITQAKDDEGKKSPLSESEQASIDNVNFGFTIYEGNTALANKTYYIYDADNNLTGTASTNSRGHFTLRNGQTARFNVDISEDGKNYHVVEDNLDEAGYTEPEYTWSSSISGAAATSEADGYTGMTVEASGSFTATDTISFVCENFLDANLPNPGVAPTNDMYVIDYGLPVNIESVISNDVWRGETIEVTSVQEVGDYISESGTYGNVGWGKDGSVTYTLSKPLDRVVTLQYNVEVTGTGNYGNEELTETAEGSAYIYIIPATSMYYEENFSDMITYSDGKVVWTDENYDNTYGSYQEEGEVGNANDSTYGTDSVYLNNLGDSYGTSKHASTVGGYAATFEYDFTGTGTAIYSRISDDSAYIQVKITKDGKTEDLQYIDTRIIGDVAANEELYNIPVYNNSGLDHGTYHVTVTVYRKGTPVNGWKDGSGNLVSGSNQSGSEFYLDGIRVYQPLIDDDIAESAYAADGESNVEVINIRSKAVTDYADEMNADEIFTLTDIDNKIMSIDDYSSIGPNEELYLTGESDGEVYYVSFYLINWSIENYDLYLGMKAPAGEQASVLVDDQTITLKNSTDCYYNISDYVTVEQYDFDDDGVDETPVGAVTISGSSGLVSLTNIKVTGIDKFDLGSSEDLSGDENGDIEVTSNTLYLVPSTYALPGDSKEDGEVSEEVFIPESIEMNCGYASKTKKATITVVTSKDVAYVTINGTKVDPKAGSDFYKFSETYKKVTKGTTYKVIAYNADGSASETYTLTAE